MNVDHLVFFDRQLIGIVSQRAADQVQARSIHKPRRCQFYTRQQATRWINGMHALAGGHWKGILKVVLPDAAALYMAYRSLADDEYLFVPTKQAFVLGDKVLLELAQTHKHYYFVTRIILCHREASSELPAGVGLVSVASEQLCKRAAR